MPIPAKIKKYLEGAQIKYEVVPHKTVYTAHDKATTLKFPIKAVGKTLVMKMGNRICFALLPGNRILDKVRFKKAANSTLHRRNEKAINSVDFAKEAWMKNNLKGVKLGAVPPFGKLWKLLTFADRGVAKNLYILLSGGDYETSIKIKASDLRKLIPDLVVGSFSKAK